MGILALDHRYKPAVTLRNGEWFGSLTIVGFCPQCELTTHSSERGLISAAKGILP